MGRRFDAQGTSIRGVSKEVPRAASKLSNGSFDACRSRSATFDTSDQFVEATSTAPDTEDETAVGPCSTYRLDVSGENFGDCVCGFSKRAHRLEASKAAAAIEA